MAKAKELHSDMAHARLSDGINVIFDQNSPDHSCSRSCRSGSGTSSASSRGRQRGRCRSSSSTSSSSSSSSRSSCHSRSRSRPRCHRGSSRCRCEDHSRYGRGRYRRSPPRRYRARHHSHTWSPSPDRYSRRRRYRSRSGSDSRSRSRSPDYQSRRRNRRMVSRHSRRVSRSPRSQRSRSKSPSPGRSLHLSPEDKRKLLEAAQANAMRVLGTNELELPDSVKPILSSRPPSKWETPETRVSHDSEKAPPKSEVEPAETPSLKMSPKSRIISFSINNSVARPTVAAAGAKVTARADSYESRKPYGHWIPVKSV